MKKPTAAPLSRAIAEAQTPSERKALFEKFYFHRLLSPQSRHYQELAQQACDTEKNKRAVAAYGRAEVIQLIDRAVGKPKVSVPTLFVFGRHDPLVDIERARRAIAALPQASMIVCEESSHHPFVDEPERFAQAVRAFLERHLRRCHSALKAVEESSYGCTTGYSKYQGVTSRIWKDLLC